MTAPAAMGVLAAAGLGDVLTSVAVFVLTAAAVIVGYRPVRALVVRQQALFDLVLCQQLLLAVSPRVATLLTGVVMVMLALICFVLTKSVYGALGGLAIGALLPGGVLRVLRRRRLARLESQLVNGLQTLASGVRAGLNFVQAMQLVARDGPIPLRQEFRHLLQEYEYGLSLEDAMNNAAERIGSTDFRLVFSALLTHRERGGDLANTLDRISDAIREIQRLESRVKTLTAQGRANARFLGLLVIGTMIIYYLIDSSGVRQLFADDIGKLILMVIGILVIVGFLWIRKIIDIDI